MCVQYQIKQFNMKKIYLLITFTILSLTASGVISDYKYESVP